MKSLEGAGLRVDIPHLTGIVIDPEVTEIVRQDISVFNVQFCLTVDSVCFCIEQVSSVRSEYNPVILQTKRAVYGQGTFLFL